MLSSTTDHDSSFGRAPAWRVAWIFALGSTLAACDAEPTGEAPAELDLSYVDRRTQVPAGEDFALPKADAPGKDAPRPEDCGTRTGRNDAGQCEFLATRDAGYAQRVLLPAGRAFVGRVPVSYDGAAGRSSGHLSLMTSPPRHVEVGSVWMDLHEVTREAYAACVEQGACTPARCHDGADGQPTHREFDERLLARLPQTCVTHAQALSFCTAHDGRLPTAAEWEYAARGVDGRPYPWGSEVRDELGMQLVPAGVRVDESYFHLLGFGSSGAEWVADRFEPDLALAPFLAGAFRSEDGPLARSTRSWEASFLCGGEAGCRASRVAGERHLAKGPAPANVHAPYDHLPANFSASTSPEGGPLVGPDPSLGFRCAADPAGSDPRLRAPASPPEIPYLAEVDGLELWGGAVAEVVNLAEATAFCRMLRNPGDGDEVRGGWRLPTRAEIRARASHWRGPGPFWASDGAVVQDESGWSEIEADAGEGLLARCVRG